MSQWSKAKRDKRRKQAKREENRNQGIQSTRSVHQGQPGKASISINTDKLGAPGIQQELHFVATYGDDKTIRDNHSREALGDTEERDFQLIAHLSKTPSPFTGNTDLSLDTGNGSSLVLRHPEADFEVIDTTFGRINIHTNASREFSALELNCRATSRNDVLGKHSDTLLALIDHMSFNHEVPLFIRNMAVWDKKNHIASATFTSPHRPTLLSDTWTSFELSMRPYYALYREALSNPSVFYQFLCFAKILEGIFRKSYPETIREAKSHGLSVPRFDARVMNHPELQGKSKDWIGEGIQKTFNDYLQPEFRNAIAHFAESEKDPLIVSNYITSAQVASNILLARICARGAITAFEKIIQDLKTSLAASSPTAGATNSSGSP